jgi:hypothetical protein
VIGVRKEIVLALDWTDFEKDDHSTPCAYVVTRHGRATPLTWKTVKQSSLTGKRNDYANGWMRKNIQDELAAARSQMVSDPGKTEYYSPPAVTNRVVNGIVDSNRHVKIRVVATAVDASEVQ